MRRFTLLGLSLLVAGIVTAGNVTGKAGERIKRMNASGRSLVSVPGMNDRSSMAIQLKQSGMWNAPKMAPVRPAEETGSSAAAELTGNMAYDNIYGPDGKTWFFTQSFTGEANEYTGSITYYESSDIIIYDDSHNKAGEIKWTCPAGKNVNAIYPYGQVTTKMFDNNANTKEVVVFVHYVNGEGDTTDSTYVYNLQGEVVCKYEGQITDVVDVRQNSYSSYQRAILMTQKGNLYSGEDVELRFDVIKPGGYSSEPVVEHTFTIDYDLINYCEGPCFSVCDVDGEPYYVLSHYEKDYVSGFDSESLDIIPTEDNHYVLDVYNRNFARVDSFGVTIDNKPEDALYRMASFSMFSDNDMSKNFFTDSGELNYVVTYQDYYTSTDAFVYSFNVFNGKGELQKTIFENVDEGGWVRLADLRGHDEQWAFLNTVGTSQQINLVDLPGCETATVIPSEIDGETISFTFDRYPKGDSYQYAMKLLSGTADADGNTIARIGWYNKDITLDRYVSFNLGPNGLNFQPLITNYTLDPYTFDTDDEHEYIFISTERTYTGTGTDSYNDFYIMEVAREDGTLIREFSGDGTTTALYTGGIINYGTENPELYTVTRSMTTPTTYNISMYSLPFNKFAAGGTGTADDPYIISTLGDMQQMRVEPSASYRLAADIDMSECPTAWEPIESFTGTLDGDGHALKNFAISSDESMTGLFGMLGNGSKVRDLTMLNPELTLNSDNSFAGIIAGQAMTDSISNVHIYGATISGSAGSTGVGGFVGQAALYSEITGSSFDGIINVPSATSVGGIVGETRTSSNVVACAVTGSITAATSIGGIVGTTSTSSEVSDCHADVTLKGENTIGGIVGTNGDRAAVKRNYVTGTIEGTEASLWDGLPLGGIVGYLTPEYGSTKEKVISGNVVAADIVYPEALTEEDLATIHRIVGWTIANEGYGDSEAGLADNYALSTMTVGGVSVTSDDDTSINGETIEQAGLTTDFFTGLGYAYGTTKAAPWKETTSLPVLWFENVARGITFSPESVTIEVGQTADVTVTVYGTDASELDLQVSDEDVASYEIIDEDDNTQTIRITCKKEGTAVITAAVDGVTAQCVVSCVATAIDGVTATSDSLTIRLADGRIEAEGASSLTVYNAAGQLTARAAGSSIATAGMTKGIYVVVATAGDGRTETAKMVVK